MKRHSPGAVGARAEADSYLWGHGDVPARRDRSLTSDAISAEIGRSLRGRRALIIYASIRDACLRTATNVDGDWANFRSRRAYEARVRSRIHCSSVCGVDRKVGSDCRTDVGADVPLTGVIPKCQRTAETKTSGFGQLPKPARIGVVEWVIIDVCVEIFLARRSRIKVPRFPQYDPGLDKPDNYKDREQCKPCNSNL